jgi:hypothetical protein
VVMKNKPQHDAEQLDQFMTEFTKRARSYGLDSVHVIGTLVNSNHETERISVGSGNWYSRTGAMREWLKAELALEDTEDIF